MECPDSILSRFSRQFILEGIKIILNYNTFFFDDRLLRKKGTAMGTKMAPSSATLIPGYLEKQMYQKAVTEFGEEMASYIENNWLRYLDDRYINWVFGEEYLNEFHKLLNFLTSNIKFTIEYNRGQITFLDVLIKKDQDRLLTDINYKITDTKQYLDYSSNHPLHIERNIP